jgi:hypothetical protein
VRTIGVAAILVAACGPPASGVQARLRTSGGGKAVDAVYASDRGRLFRSPERLIAAAVDAAATVDGKESYAVHILSFGRWPIVLGPGYAEGWSPLKGLSIELDGVAYYGGGVVLDSIRVTGDTRYPIEYSGTFAGDLETLTGGALL